MKKQMPEIPIVGFFREKSQEETNNIQWFVQGMRANAKSWPSSEDGKLGHDPFSLRAQKPVQERNTFIVRQIITTPGGLPKYQAEGKWGCDPISIRHNGFDQFQRIFVLCLYANLLRVFNKPVHIVNLQTGCISCCIPSPHSPPPPPLVVSVPRTTLWELHMPA